MTDEIPDLDLFLWCETVDPRALVDVPAGHRVRSLRADEVEVWMDLHVDDESERDAYHVVLRDFLDRVYAPRFDEFLARCRVVVDADDVPVATAFLWRTSAGVVTFHWLKVRGDREGRGLGRAIASDAMRTAGGDPVLLHTHPSSYRAVGLYADLGFALLTDPMIGSRTNDLEVALPILRREMTPATFARLRTRAAPAWVLAALADETTPEF